jgi:uncharacterized protein
VLLARGRERLERVARELGADAESCDLGDRQQVEEVAARVGARHPAVQLLANSAGIPGGGGFLGVSPERIAEVTNVNYLGSVWSLLAFLPMLERGAPAAVVNVVSVAGAIAAGSSGPYTASKHAQLAFSRSVAAELAPRGIHVLSVNPGPAATAGFPQRRLLRGRWSRHAVIGPERVADAIVRGLQRGRREIFVPGPLRLAATVEALAPVTAARLAPRRREDR